MPGNYGGASLSAMSCITMGWRQGRRLPSKNVDRAEILWKEFVLLIEDVDVPQPIFKIISQNTTKSLMSIFKYPEDGKRILREIKLMQIMNHRNILTILDYTLAECRKLHPCSPFHILQEGNHVGRLQGSHESKGQRRLMCFSFEGK